MFDFDFLEKSLGRLSPPYFVYDFQEKRLILMFDFITWPNIIIWLPLLLEILIKMWIAITC